VAILDGGGYILTGSTTAWGAGASDVYLVKTDASGNQDQSFGNKTWGDEHRDGGGDVIETLDGGFLIVGSTENHYEPLPIDDWYSDLYIIKTDASGNEEWSKVYGGDRGEGSGLVRQMEDGSFIILGGTSSYGRSRDNDIYLLRVTDRGEVITSIPVENQIKPETFMLYQNYPNPFNNTTRITYSLAKNSQVNISIYNNQGKLVKELHTGVQNRGLHSIRFNADNLASGFYFYRIKADNFLETKRMLLLK